MAVFTRSLKVSLNYANFDSVLEDDFLIYAWATPTGLRYVSIEDINEHYLSIHKKPNIGKKSNKTIVGIGANIEDAFKQALVAINKGFSYQQMYSKKARQPKISLKTTSRLDSWVLKNKGTMSVVKDEDGSIICTLEGLKDPNKSMYEQIRVSGVGFNFRTAYRNALIKLSPNNTPSSRVHRIQISTL